MSKPFANFDELCAAYDVVRGFVRHTPLLEAPLLNDELGIRLLFKPECLQTTGSFKLRGAYHLISQLPEDVRKRGVLAFSSGNHAQAVAYVARHFGIPATIVMPNTAPKIKWQNTEHYGARVIGYNISEDREAVAAKINAEQPGLTLVKPFDDRRILLGQGTAMWEAWQDCQERNIVLDQAYICCSGGGLLAGSALALSQSDAEVFVAEADGYESAAAAMRHGRPINVFDTLPDKSRLCDAVLSPIVGEACFGLIQEHVSGSVTVKDPEVYKAMKLAFEHLKLVVEPGGATGFAAVLNRRDELQGKTVLVMLSGGNVDAETLVTALQSYA